MEVKVKAIKLLVLAFALVICVAPVVGCSKNADEDYDPSKIAVPQPPGGPPPMGSPGAPPKPAGG